MTGMNPRAPSRLLHAEGAVHSTAARVHGNASQFGMAGRLAAESPRQPQPT